MDGCDGDSNSDGDSDSDSDGDGDGGGSGGGWPWMRWPWMDAMAIDGCCHAMADDTPPHRNLMLNRLRMFLSHQR